MSTDRPDWLIEPCPAWCSGDHDGQSFDADRQHQSASPWQPAVMLHRGVHRRAVSAEFCVIAVRLVGDEQTWVAIATETQQMECSRESARRLHAELARLLPDLE